MLQSRLFTKTRKEAPKDEVSKNAKLLIKSGFVHKEMAGVYSFLPLGLRTLEKVNGIIRDEMDKAGGQELFLSSLQNKESWEATERWGGKSLDIWFKTKLAAGGEVGLGFTHEEPLTALMKDHIRSFRDLPVYAYQIQTKFRNEERAKSGLMRTREFLMKDLYSFSRDTKEHEVFYEILKKAYTNVFSRVGLGDLTYMTYASGGSFSKYSHEFQTLSDAGEDTIHVCEKCKVAVNKEIIAEQPDCPVCGNKKLLEKKAVEVGNIFSLGTRFSEALGLSFINEQNESKPVIMGSYGIGPARLIGTIAEIFSDEKGMVWPLSISPFAVHLVLLNASDEAASRQANLLYIEMQKEGIEVLFDDRDARAGEKFADADLIGIPFRVVVSGRNIKAGTIELSNRTKQKAEHVKFDTVVKTLQSYVQ